MPALSNGSRLGPYEILEAIGAGGMGEVYRGRDTRLDRVVAIKVLAAGLATDITSRERFEREAKAISSLNHPNICVLHDVGRERPAGTDGAAVDFLVMEYLEGETLSARLARGPSRASRNDAINRAESLPGASASPPLPSTPSPPLTVEEALAIAIPIAAALDCAHRQGVVHRDLKPGNVMLSNNTVKLLDFGLARLSAATGSGRTDGPGHGMVSLADMAMPTVSSPLTLKGTILGTLQYMAPEQLEGKEVDARADIFALGGLLYEMLTGRRPFEGRSQASLIGAILDHEPPPVTTYQPISPPLLDEVVARCLAKNPDDRWQSARDVRAQLEWIARQLAAGNSAAAVGPQAALASRHGGRAWRTGLALVLTALVVGSAVAWVGRPPPAVRQVVARFAVELPEDQRFTRGGRHVVALSPDGSRLVYVANSQLYLRAMDELTAAPISGTVAADVSEPMFSPDGQWIAFWSSGELHKIPVTGGTPISLGAVQNPWGGSWQGDGILLGQNTPRGIVHLPSVGGTPTLLLGVDETKGEWAHGPQLIADGRAVLFTLRIGGGTWDDAKIVVHDLSTGRRVVLVDGGTDARLLPTGHLVYVREATMFAVTFDAARLALAGQPVAVHQGIQQTPPASSGAAQFAWSASGTLVVVPGEAFSMERTLTWIDRQGREERTPAEKRAIAEGGAALRISPDGTRVALTIRTEQSDAGVGARRGLPTTDVASDVWIWEMARNTLTRLSMTNRASGPVWAPDGRKVCYDSALEVLCQAADGSSPAQTMFKVDGLRNVKSISGDGKQLLLEVRSPETRDDIMIATLGAPAEVRPLIQTNFQEFSPVLSPDGRWLAYDSNESGRAEVYVRPFPAVDQGRWQVSVNGGIEPRWSHDGRELFFAADGPGPRMFWAVAVQSAQGFVAGTPILVATLENRATASYDIARDGRLLVSLPTTRLLVSARPQLLVVQHWFEELKARVAAAAAR